MAIAQYAVPTYAHTAYSESTCVAHYHETLASCSGLLTTCKDVDVSYGAIDMRTKGWSLPSLAEPCHTACD